MQTFGSDTSRTERLLALYVGSFVSGAAAGSFERKSHSTVRALCKVLITGTPAGKNLSRLLTGIMKQSRSSVANEIGSLLELTKAPVAEPGWPPKLTRSFTEE
jgi:hypothetical protein